MLKFISKTDFEKMYPHVTEEGKLTFSDLERPIHYTNINPFAQEDEEKK